MAFSIGSTLGNQAEVDRKVTLDGLQVYLDLVQADDQLLGDFKQIKIRSTTSADALHERLEVPVVVLVNKVVDDQKPTVDLNIQYLQIEQLKLRRGSATSATGSSRSARSAPTSVSTQSKCASS